MARALQRTLRGHDITLANGGRQAIELLDEQQPFDVIFCDLMMPEVFGIEVHAWAQEHAPEQAARMVFVTGGAFGDEARRFVEQVPHRYLDKPFDPDVVRALVSELRRPR